MNPTSSPRPQRCARGRRHGRRVRARRRELPDVVHVERPRQREHGDWATNVALQLAQAGRGAPARSSPRCSRGRLRRRPRASRRSTSPGPGFLNITLDGRRRGRARARRRRAGRRPTAAATSLAGKTVNLEFVSANPTGPIHIGGVRWAAVGDSLARVLEAARRRGHPRVLLQRPRRADRPLRALAARRAPRARTPPRTATAAQYIHDIADEVIADVAAAGGARPAHAARRRGAGGLPRRRRRADVRRDQGVAARLRRRLRRLLPRGLAARVRRGRAGDRAAARARRTSTRPTARCGCAPPTSATTRTASSSSPTATPPTSPATSRTTSTSASAASTASSSCSAPTTTGTSAGMMADVRRVRRRPRAQPRDPHRPDGQPRQATASRVRMSKRAGTVVTIEDLVDAVGVDAARYALARSAADSTIDIDLDLLARARPTRTPCSTCSTPTPARVNVGAQRRRARRRAASDGFDAVAARPPEPRRSCSAARPSSRAWSRRPPSCASRTASPATSRSSPAAYHKWYDAAPRHAAGRRGGHRRPPHPPVAQRRHPPGARERPGPARRQRAGADVSAGVAPGRRWPVAGRDAPTGRRRSTRRGRRRRATSPREHGTPALRARRGRLPRPRPGVPRGVHARRSRRSAPASTSTTPARRSSRVAVARWVHEEGLRVDTAHRRRARRRAARRASRARDIGLHGNNKSDAELARALEAGVGRIVVDSLAEIERVARRRARARGRLAPVMVRVTTGVHAGGHEYIATGARGPEVRPLARRRAAAMTALRAVLAPPRARAARHPLATSARRSSTPTAFEVAARTHARGCAPTSHAATGVPRCPRSTSAAATASPTCRGDDPSTRARVARALAATVGAVCAELGTPRAAHLDRARPRDRRPDHSRSTRSAPSSRSRSRTARTRRTWRSTAA